MTTKVFSDLPEDVAVSSHFRASVSPQRSGRVHRMSDEELADELANDMDFDRSILDVRSPLKVMKERPVVPEVEEAVDEVDEDITHAQQEQENIIPAVVEEMMHDAEVVQTADPSEIEVVLPKNDQQAVVDEMVKDSEVINTAAPSEIEISIMAHDDEDEEQTVPDAESATPSMGPPVARGLSGMLFRSERTSSGESSEDELAGEQTPARPLGLFRSSLTGATARSRLSTGISSSVNHNVGFTPLAAQMSGWLAASPKKRARKTRTTATTFSPIAAQHIDGKVMISRQSTPQQKTPLGQRSTGKRQSFDPRMSLAGSEPGSTNKSSFFEEQMAGIEADEAQSPMPVSLAEDVNMLAEMNEIDEALEAEVQAAADDDQMTDDGDDTVLVNEPAGELTTDLIKFTNASDTAMVDFESLAREAEELHDEEEDISEASFVNENTVPLSGLEVTGVIGHTTAQEQFAEFPEQTSDNDMENEVVPLVAVAVVGEQTIVEPEAESPSLTSTSPVHDTAPQMTDAPAPEDATVEPTSSPSPSPVADLNLATPIQQPDYSKPRYHNTVVSKVPLRPEGHISPIKMPKKRSRSLSNTAQVSPPKRAALTPNNKLTPRAVSDNVNSPTPSRANRSAAPSPAMTTPGQMSFAIDDFGDSTLDGIDLPADEMETEENDAMDFEITNPMVRTPATAKSTRSQPAKSTATTPSRTPLKPLLPQAQGILSSAIVFVDVYTSEGADASGVYIDLLTQMGAKCVKDWRWNPRASIAGANAAEEGPNSAKAGNAVGITHVVYKDGGKRTLEKVRDAKGEVCCVGVRWVLEYVSPSLPFLPSLSFLQPQG
jgi:hypothetical protein